MKCKQHPCERGVGVCASCLRERLLALILEQNGAAAHRRRGSDPPPPLNFPRSVSPSHRRSDASLPHHRRHNIQRFFSTPQVGPASSAAAADYDGNIRNSSSGRFSVLSALFGRHGSADSWLGSLLRGRKMKRKPRMPDSDERMAYRDRGMSPERPSPSSSEYLPESSSPAWWRRPAPSPMRRSRAASGFAVCLSPLVWASPGGRRSVEAAGVSGELRRCSGSGPAVLVPNRSRKLADLGRFK